jgi:predicted transcriptional regulator of viral defense system
MAGKCKPHTKLGIELARRLAAEGERIFTTARAREFAPSVGLSERYFRQALHHLARSGWVIRLRNGLYALSSAVPGVTHVHEFEIATALVAPAAVSHWSALRYHDLTDQIPRRVFVLTTTEASIPRLRGRRRKSVADGYSIGGTVYQFIQVKPDRFFGTQKVWIMEARVAITDPERTLLDGLSRPRYCGDFAEVFRAFELLGRDLDVDRAVAYALKLDVATAKRLGWVLERQGVDSARLETLALVPVKGYRKLDPTGPRAGPRNRRWMIQENLVGKVMM